MWIVVLVVVWSMLYVNVVTKSWILCDHFKVCPSPSEPHQWELKIQWKLHPWGCKPCPHLNSTLNHSTGSIVEQTVTIFLGDDGLLKYTYNIWCLLTGHSKKLHAHMCLGLREEPKGPCPPAHRGGQKYLLAPPTPSNWTLFPLRGGVSSFLRTLYQWVHDVPAYQHYSGFFQCNVFGVFSVMCSYRVLFKKKKIQRQHERYEYHNYQCLVFFT